jgi:hypothetical protein
MKLVSTFTLVVLISVTSLAQKVTSAEDLIRKMHKKYHNNFNANITFIQLNQDFDEAGKVTHSMSFEAFHYPGRFRNDKGPVPQKEGYIVANDIMYEFKDGKITGQKPCTMDVGLLTGDIYFMNVDKAIEECKKHGYNMSKFREDMFKGKPVYVVGANDSKDEKSPQFWIDAEELYVVRDINFSEEDNEFEDVHYLEHAKVENAWVEERVEIFVNGKLIKKEHYAEVKANNELNLDIFDPKKIGLIHWRSK